MQAQWLDIAYFDFWDLPRTFLTKAEGSWYCFSCTFNEDIDDYEPDFRVYEMPDRTAAEIAERWRNIHKMLAAGIAPPVEACIEIEKVALRYVGAVPASSVRFDDTRRKQICADVLYTLLQESRHRQSSEGPIANPSGESGKPTAE
jgi:hypothetical protein